MTSTKFFFLSFFLIATTTLLSVPAVTTQEPAAAIKQTRDDALFAESTRNALDLAGALINDGFRNRDGVWNIALTPEKTSFLEVTLFAGNQYWFVAAATSPAQTLKITCYDHEGDPIKLDSWKDDHTVGGARRAAGFLATKSGNYFVGLTLVNSRGNQKADASLIYAYK